MSTSSDTKWKTIHGLFKGIIRSSISSILTTGMYMLKSDDVLVENKSDLKSNELKRFWAAWDIAFSAWEKETGVNFINSDLYRELERFRNVILTIIDNDGVYLKLVYQFIRAWENVKEDDSYLK